MPPAVRLSPDSGDVVKLKPADGDDEEEGEEAPLPYLVYNKMPFEVRACVRARASWGSGCVVEMSTTAAYPSHPTTP